MANKSYSEKLLDPRWQKKSGIYKLIINEKSYVGSAVDLSKRIRSHYNDLISKRHVNIHLQRAFNLYHDISFEIIEFVPDIKDLIQREQYYIDSLQPEYNIAKTAGSMLGFRHSEETKIKISRIQIGKQMSQETRINMSIARKGIKLTEEHCKNIALAKMGAKNPFYKAGPNHPQFGTHRSEKTKEKLRGDNNWTSKSGVLYDVETGSNYIFRSLRNICNKMGLTYRGVLSALRNERFYKGRYYINFVEIPTGIETRINK